MNITKESASATEVTLNVELDSEDVEPFISRSYRRVVSRVNIPGFRPGKAPRSIVESHLGRPALVQEALEFMVPETLDQVLKQENLQAFMEPELEILDIEPVSFKAVVPLEPVVELGDPSSINVQREPVDISQDQVNDVIEKLRYDSAPWEPVDRPVQFGDLLSLNVTGTIGGEQAINDQGIDFIPQVDNPLPIKGFSIYLEGMKEGQEKEFSLTIPDDHHQSQYAGTECHIRVEVLSVKTKALPELDDEFAKGVRDGYESLEALGSYMRQQLTEAAENTSARRLEQEGLEELLKISTIQASEMIYQRELDRLYEERERAIRGQQLDMDTYLSYIGTTKEEWREQLQPQAEQRLNNFLVLRKLAQDQGIDIEPEEVQAEIDSMLEESGDSENAMRRVLGSDDARESIRSSLLSRKVLGRLVEIIEGVTMDTSPQAQAGPDEVADEPSSSDEETPGAESNNPGVTPEETKEGAKPDAE